MSTDEVKVESGNAAEAAAEFDGASDGAGDDACSSDAVDGAGGDTSNGAGGNAGGDTSDSAGSGAGSDAGRNANGNAGDGVGGDTGEDVGENAHESDVDGGPVKPTRLKHRRMRDMALSLAVLLVPLGLFYAGWSWLASDRQVSVVDTTENYSTAASLGLAVIEPELSDEWKPISTDLAVEGETVTLRTGWYSPEGDGLQLVETNGTAADVNEDISGVGTPVEAGGIEWASYELGSGEAWVAELDGETIVLTAEADGVNELPELAEGVAEAV